MTLNLWWVVGTFEIIISKMQGANEHKVYKLHYKPNYLYFLKKISDEVYFLFNIRS